MTLESTLEQLERLGLELIDEIDVTDEVLRALNLAEQPIQPPRRRRRLGLVGVALVAAALAVLPGPRGAIASWLGIGNTRIEPGITPTTGQSTPASNTPPDSAHPPVAAPSSFPDSPATPPGPGGISGTSVAPFATLGPEVSGAAAEAETGLRVPVIAGLGTPRVYVQRPPDSGQIVLLYAASSTLPESKVTGVGAIVSVARARLDDGAFRKGLDPATVVEPLTVNGSPGVWLSGEPHSLSFISGDEYVVEELRLATNTLLWQADELMYRIEADISKEQAVALAASLNP